MESKATSRQLKQPSKYTRRRDAYHCPVELTLDLISSKWKVLILYRLHEVGDAPLRFSELLHSISGITEKMLTNQLRELESDKLIGRAVYAVVPPKVEYRLSEYGVSLMPIIVAMREWGERYHDETGTANQELDKAHEAELHV